MDNMQIEILTKQRDNAIKFAAELAAVCLKAQSKESCDKYLKRLKLGAVNTYMGSGYAFIDEFNRVWDENFNIPEADEYVYRAIREIVEKPSE